MGSKTFQERYEAWKNGADYWKDIRGINLGGDAQEELSDEDKKKLDDLVTNILAEYDRGKGQRSVNDTVNSFVYRMGPLVGKALNRYGYDVNTYYNVMRLLAYESKYGTSDIARNLHNYGGVGYNGKTYTTYKSDEDFVNNYVSLMHRKYNTALRAKSVQDYARALKSGGYYKDTLENYTRNLMGMNTLTKAAFTHRKLHPDMYNYLVKLTDLIDDYEEAKRLSPVMRGVPTIEKPQTINAAIPRTLLGPTEDLNKVATENFMKRKVYEDVTTPTIPLSMLLPLNNFGKDAYGLKFWWRRNNNLHFDEGKDERIAGSNPSIPDKVELQANLELGYGKNHIAVDFEKDAYGTGETIEDFYDAGQLDDVVAKPSNYDKRLLNITKRMFPNKNDRDLVYNYLLNEYNGRQSFNDRLLNTILLYKLSGAPSISDKSKSNFNILRSHYAPYLNRIYVYPSDFISELSHAYLYNNPIRKPLLIKSNISSGKGTDYKRKGSIEHLAHYSIEPWLKFFIETGDKKYLNKAMSRANKEYDKYGNWLWDEGKDPYLYQSGDYDFVQARDLGYLAESDGHWPSRNYKTGRYLKSPVHPTLYKGIISDNSLGYYPYYKDGAIYTNTWKGNEPYTGMLENYIQYRYGKSKKKVTKTK